MYKIVITCMISIVWLCCVPSTHAQLDNIDNPLTAEWHSGGAQEVAVIGLNDASATDGWQGDALINVIKWWVNWILGILALIALLILIYGGLLMVTAAGSEDRYSKWWTILKQAAIGLIVIGVSWFIVSIIFWLINISATNVDVADTQS